MRVLLKLSGESLCAEGGSGWSVPALERVADELLSTARAGVQLAVVLGGGNVFRGAQLRGSPVGRDAADRMGMLATLMNGLALRDVLRARGGAAQVLTGLRAPEVAATLTRQRALAAHEEGRIVLCAGGTGHPYFTTDTAAALRALEVGAELLLKATKFDGVYSADPAQDPTATRYDTITFQECLERRLEVMDQAAFALCRDNGLAVVVFDMDVPGRIRAAATGERVGTRVVVG